MCVEQDVEHTSKYQLLFENHYHQSEMLNMKRKSKNTYFDVRRLDIFNREKGKYLSGNRLSLKIKQEYRGRHKKVQSWGSDRVNSSKETTKDT